ncbi:MAG: glycosyltransferase family 4 protein [Planctomycetes bacterium]|nr:glycosyltransferase family 4 protein [Planctomycetota bacterium]
MSIALDVSPACGQWTGVGRYVIDLARGLADADKPVAGVYQGHHGPPDGVLAHSCTALRRYDLLGGRPGLWLRLPRHLRALGADVYHAPTTIGVPGRSWSGRIVATVQDCYPLIPGSQVTPRSRRLFTRLLGAICSRAAAIICPSRMSADAVRCFGWSGPIEIIHYGIASVKVGPRPATAVDRPYLLTIGAIEPRKGLDVIARAIARMGASAPPWVHIGPDRHDPGGAIRAAMRASGCRMLGYVPDGERMAWLAHAALLAQPSSLEGFGYPPLEAMHAGVPVVARSIDVMREVLADAAQWVETAEPEAWASAIAEVMRDERARRDLAARGRERAARFTLARMASEHLAVYHGRST